MIRLYGIRNCDTMRKARRWLRERKLEHEFHDFRESGIDAARLARWLEKAGCRALVNRRSTTWRTLDDAHRQRIEQGDCLDVLREHPTLIRRPVAEFGGELLIGFDPASWERTFS